MQKIKDLDKSVFAFDRSNYREIIPLMFDYIPKNQNKKEILTAKILSGNNKFHFDTSSIDKTLKYLSNPEF